MESAASLEQATGLLLQGNQHLDDARPLRERLERFSHDGAEHAIAIGSDLLGSRDCETNLNHRNNWWFGNVASPPPERIEAYQEAAQSPDKVRHSRGVAWCLLRNGTERTTLGQFLNDECSRIGDFDAPAAQ